MVRGSGSQLGVTGGNTFVDTEEEHRYPSAAILGTFLAQDHRRFPDRAVQRTVSELLMRTSVRTRIGRT
jgi:hypothetical protein